MKQTKDFKITDYCIPEELPVIDLYFPDKKIYEMRNLINKLKLQDVETDKKFNTILQRIKNKILLNPVEFDKFKIIKKFLNEKKILIVIVKIKFTGTCELFGYKPKDCHYDLSDPKIYQPTENSICLEIESFNIEDKNKILEKAQQRLQLTFDFIKSNNTFIKNWNSSIEPTIEIKLRAHKKTLENLYKS